jgi:hypothetical protein
MNKWLYVILFAIFIVGISAPSADAQQIITVNNTPPCFLNYTAGPDLWENCGMADDYISTALLPWEWITGGNFSMILASILVLFTYIKYHKAIYPILIGIFMLPLSFFVFPESFLSWAAIMTFVAVGILIWYTYTKQTKEYS